MWRQESGSTRVRGDIGDADWSALGEHLAEKTVPGRRRGDARRHLRFETAPKKVTKVLAIVGEQPDGGIAGADDFPRRLAIAFDQPERIALEGELPTHVNQRGQPGVHGFQLADFLRQLVGEELEVLPVELLGCWRRRGGRRQAERLMHHPEDRVWMRRLR